MFTSETPGVANARSSAGPMAPGCVDELAVSAERLDHLVVADARRELGHDVVAEQRLHRMLLQTPDAVVADDRGDVHAVTHERFEIAERETDRAVAEQQHDLAVGMRDTRRQRVARPHAEAAVRSGIEECPRLEALDELPRVRDEVAAVADHDRVAVEALAELAVDARRLDRSGVGLERTALPRRASARSSARSARDPVVVRIPGGAPDVGQLRERRREIARGRRRERGVPSRPRSRRRHRCTTRGVTEPAEAETEVEGRARHEHEVGLLQRERPRPRERELVVGGQRPPSHPVHEHRHPGRLGERAHARPPRGPSRRRHRRPARVAPIPRRVAATRGHGVGVGSRAPEPVVAFDRRARRPTAGPNASSGMSTKVGPRCGVRAARHAASTSATIDAADVAVAARLGDRLHDRDVIELLQRTRTPTRLRRSPGEHDHGRTVHASRRQRAHAVRHARAGGQRRAAEPARHLGEPFGRERRRSARGARRRAGVPACTAPSYRTNRCPPDSVNIVSTPWAPQHLDREPPAVRLHEPLPAPAR